QVIRALHQFGLQLSGGQLSITGDNERTHTRSLWTGHAGAGGKPILIVIAGADHHVQEPVVIGIGSKITTRGRNVHDVYAVVAVRGKFIQIGGWIGTPSPRSKG